MNTVYTDEENKKCPSSKAGEIDYDHEKLYNEAEQKIKMLKFKIIQMQEKIDALEYELGINKQD